MKICNTLDEVQRIETKVGQYTVGNLAYSDPADEMQARFSMQYCLATALLQGRLSLADFTRDGNICPANVPDQGITAAIKSKLNQIPIQTADTAMVPIYQGAML